MCVASGKLSPHRQMHGQANDIGATHSMDAVSDPDSNCRKHKGLDGSLGLSESLSLAVIQ